jgi:hypothetical protein
MRMRFNVRGPGNAGDCGVTAIAALVGDGDGHRVRYGRRRYHPGGIRLWLGNRLSYLEAGSVGS